MRLTAPTTALVVALVVIPSASAHHAPYLGIAATWGGEGSAPGQFTNRITALATGPDGSIYALEDTVDPDRITRFDSEGRVLARWNAGSGTGGAGDIAVGASGALYVTKGPFAAPGEVLKFSRSGELLAKWDGTNGTPAFTYPGGIATDRVGNVYVSASRETAEDTDTASAEDTGIFQVTEDGAFVRKIGIDGFFYAFFSLARDSDGFFYATPSTWVARLDPRGAYVGQLGFGAAGPQPGHFNGVVGAAGVAVAADDTVWVADPYNRRVQRFGRDGAVLDVCGHADQRRPSAIDSPDDVAPSGDEVIVGDFLHIHRIGMVTHPSPPCDAIPPKLDDVELLREGGRRTWFRRSSVRFSASEPAHAIVNLQQRYRERRHWRWRGLDLGFADTQAGENVVDLSDVLDVKPKPRRGRYRLRLQLDDEAVNHSRARKLKFRVD